MTLQTVLKAYEQVLPRHGVRVEEDTYYYRLLLKLSLDPHGDWWTKLRREAGSAVGCGLRNSIPALCLHAPHTTPLTKHPVCTCLGLDTHR